MFEEIVGSSGASAQGSISRSTSWHPLRLSTVLILGQTGTGKEANSARHSQTFQAGRPILHRRELRCDPYVADCFELFPGTRRGESRARRNVVWDASEAASGGTIFLDEVGDLPQDIQIALLRVLQEREIERIGSDRSIPVDESSGPGLQPIVTSISS